MAGLGASEWQRPSSAVESLAGPGQGPPDCEPLRVCLVRLQPSGSSRAVSSERRSVTIFKEPKNWTEK